jgi:ABC-type uncharacterized transport system involved in gliding motility auxiliary subunit
MIRRLADWGGYAGLVVLAAAAILPFVRPEWYRFRWTLVVAGVLLVVASLIARIEDFRGFAGRRTVRYGLNTAVALLLVLGATVVVQALSFRHSTRWDLTENKRFSLSPQTVQLLGGLKTDINAVAFFRSDQPGKRVAEDLLKQYARYSNGKLTWRSVDPDREPGLAKRYGIESYGTIVLETKTKSEKVLDAEEKKLTNGLVRASAPSTSSRATANPIWPAASGPDSPRRNPRWRNPTTRSSRSSSRAKGRSRTTRPS